ncbi:TetR/AcrR family transcriptional regulator [Paenibacillus elgii]|uniref:TetR/AcrR family transcriptional regulator n=1 Tax=Paenibacillus elgii TaxID=189691 RepID=UPI000FDC2D42|nr:TetR/AcrR family transcriptional regulator [Paenibacillus elgii]NEN84135.1 TetR/AcrR family transcriptional regulator [Paenibacillus elgii]
MAKPNGISKQELIESAKRCIRDKGIDKLTLKAVAEGAGVTQGTVYYHFKTKEQLLFEIVQSLCDASWKVVQPAQTAGEDRLASILQALAGARERAAYRSFYHTLFFSLVVHSLQNEEMLKQLGRLLEKENAQAAELLDGWLPASARSIVSMESWGILANALMDGLALQALINPDFESEKIYAELSALLARIAAE